MGFAAATAVQRIDDTTWSGAFAPGWDIAGNADGGYLLAIAGRVGAEATGKADPVTITGHFLSPGRPGPLLAGARVLRTGRRFSTVHVTLSGNGTTMLAALGTYADLVDGPTAAERVDARPPDLPPPEDCVALEPTDSFPPPFVGKVDLRLHPDHLAGSTAGSPRVSGWFRLRDGEPIDVLALMVAVDSFPPTVFFADLPVAWVPTVEMTTHVRARPSPGWLRCAFSTRFITGGFLEEDGEVWDSTGRLVAQSRQLALLPRG
jgi:acyl-CoA thioesterase